MTTKNNDILTCKKYTCDEAGAVFKRSGRTITRWIEEGKYFDLDHIIKLDEGYLIPEYELRRTVASLMTRECPEKIKEPAAKAQTKGQKNPKTSKGDRPFKDNF